MKTIIATLSIILLTLTGSGQSITLDQLPDHPRLLLFDDNLESLKTQIASDEYWKTIHQAITEESDRMIPLPTLERIQIGRRLLDKSREALRRIYYLAYTYRVTEDEKYLKRAEAELLKISGFSDWNPTHFLDVAEMTLAAAIGYDWLYHDLSEQSRHIIETAIIEKGIKPSYNENYNSFLNSPTNWNQVCNAGMTFGALAVFEKQPELAKDVIERAIKSIKLPMEDYKPSGAYPEGAGYWTYGTSFNVLFIDAVEKIFNSDFGLTSIEGFMKTSGYIQHITGPTGYPFNYADASSRPAGLEPTIFWFANRQKMPSLIYGKSGFLKPELRVSTRDRILPSVMIWGQGLSLSHAPAPKELFWTGDGKSPVAFMRSSWTDDMAYFAGLKAGSPSVNHAHMDVGTFVADALGERWAMDFGMQQYESLESKGVKLWGKTQDAERWNILRYNNLYHNTLAFDRELQQVQGHAEIIRKSDKENFMFAITDMTEVYVNKASFAQRGLALRSKKEIIIQDEIIPRKTTKEIQWTMVTPALVSEIKGNRATMTQNGKTMYLHVVSPTAVQLKTWDTEPVKPYDAPNPGTLRLGFVAKAKKNKVNTLTVILTEKPVLDITTVAKLIDW